MDTDQAGVQAVRRVARVREYPADLETPISIYLKLRDGQPSYLLESVEGGERLGRYSFVGLQPERILRAWRGRAELSVGGRRQEYDLRGRDMLALLRELLRDAPAPVPGLPRNGGGAVGYLAYDVVRDLERLPATAADTLQLPEAVLLFCSVTVILDHVKHRLFIVAEEPVQGDARVAEERADARIAEVERRLRAPLPLPPEASVPVQATGLPAVSNMTRAQYEDAVRRAREYILAGDIFQVVPSQRLARQTHAEPFAVYRALRRLNPSPYLFFLELPDGLHLIGSSPEVLVRLQGRQAEVRPLAGTRPRGRDAGQDAALAAELLADPKERAEHVMLVDLARNDLGRVCRYGSVEVPVLMDVEYYSHVMHIVSSVVGELAEGRDALDLLRATFPAGTVSGAPKVRAMEIIEELEGTRRGPYAGAVGYFDYAGAMDLCITLRTIVMIGQTAYLQSGAGVVADSDPAKEYEEALNKLRALEQALDMAEKNS
jgi:anthranilate synthase component I